jgi:hypothetical protein
MDGVELSGQLRRVHAQPVCVLVTSFTADTTVHAENRAGASNARPRKLVDASPVWPA